MALFLSNANLVLPIVWVFVSALIALLLYRTSATFLETDSILGLPVKSLRLTGSAVIFVLVFFLLRQSTTMNIDAVPVAKGDIEQLRAAVDDAEHTAVEINACAETDMMDSQECRNHLRVLRERMARVRRQTDAVMPAPGPG